nr:hypothetical protein GCM10020092_002290 [Actinoplanes digitatis]
MPGNLPESDTVRQQLVDQGTMGAAAFGHPPVGSTATPAHLPPRTPGMVSRPAPAGSTATAPAGSTATAPAGSTATAPAGSTAIALVGVAGSGRSVRRGSSHAGMPGDGLIHSGG